MLVASSCQSAIRGNYYKSNFLTSGYIDVYTPFTPGGSSTERYYAMLLNSSITIPPGKIVNDVILTTSLTTNYAIQVYTPSLALSNDPVIQNQAIQYVVADGSANKPYWSLGNGNLRFVKGVLGANGKIYYMPFKILGASDQLVVLNTNVIGSVGSLTWSLLSPYNNTAPSFGYSGGVLGRDGKIYFIPNQTAPFVRLNTNNSANTWEVSYYDGSIGKRFVANGTGTTVYDETGSIITSTDGTSISVGANSGYTLAFSDALVHPNGNIYLLQSAGGKGRIYYCKPSNFNTIQAICSAPGLITDSLYGGTNKPIAGFAMSLERPEVNYETNSWTTPLNSLKLLLFSRGRLTGSGGAYYADPAYVQDILILDPITHTLTKKISNLSIATTVNGGSIYLVGPIVKTSTGLNTLKTYHAGSPYKSAINIFTGSNIYNPTVSKIDVHNMVTEADLNFNPHSRFINTNNLSASRMQGSFTGMSCSYVQKGNPSNTIVTGGMGLVHIIANKPHARNVKYFSYDTLNFGTTVEAEMYVKPTSITDLPTSLYNSLYNKIR